MKRHAEENKLSLKVGLLSGEGTGTLAVLGLILMGVLVIMLRVMFFVLML